MKKKQFTVEYGPTNWECTVTVDDTAATMAWIKSMVEFWIDWEERLERNEGDYTRTFLQQLAREISLIQAGHNYNLLGVVGEFESREGWCTMDGAYGIEITYVDDFEFAHDDYNVREGAYK